MTSTIVYVYPACAPQYHDYAVRFLESYHANLPGVLHETVVVVNGAAVTPEIQCLFASLPRLHFLEHDNSGYDVGAFQHASRECATEMILFFGASTFFFGPGWLLRMMTAMQKHGNAQYGTMGNRGDTRAGVWPHIRTTAFWLAPALFNAYPHAVTGPEGRHPFEHGPACFSEWVKKRGLKSWVITRYRDLTQAEWNDDPQGFHRGDQSALLAGDHICEPPIWHPGRQTR